MAHFAPLLFYGEEIFQPDIYCINDARTMDKKCRIIILQS